MNPLLPLFLEETQELIERASRELVALERQDHDDAAGTLDSVFRSFHTLKGGAALFDFAPMTNLLHAAEDVLGHLRERQAPVGRPLIDALLACLDDVSSWLPDIETTEALPAAAAAQAERTAAALGRLGASALARPDASGEPSRPLPPAAPAGDALLAALLQEQAALQAADLPAAIRQATLAAATRVTQAALRVAGAAQTPAAGASPARMLRVAPERIERIIALAAEAVVARTALRHLAAQAEAQGAASAWAVQLRTQVASLDRLVRDWNEAAARLRMVPTGDIFRRFPRLVRDLAQQLGRDVRLVLSGETLEADRDVLETLFEPLVHLVRNSLDHGIESPDERRRAGKTPTATLTLRAQRRGDALVIDVEDDGRGLDLAALRRRAIARGLLDEGAASALSDQQAADLVFLPGLSTAKAVSTVSGRGVGMDAVRSAVLGVGGTVTLDNQAGRGLRVSLSLPMQASITRIMIIEAGGTRFGVPLDAVSRMMQVPPARVLTLPVESGAGRRRAFALDEQLMPLIDLAPLLGLPQDASAGMVQALLVDTSDGPAALAVSGFGASAEIILRPLAGLMAGTAFYLGTALLGDGSVLLVLDVQALLR
jgi:two-component system chemotaxis sensor kinase CheA